MDDRRKANLVIQPLAVQAQGGFSFLLYSVRF